MCKQTGCHYFTKIDVKTKCINTSDLFTLAISVSSEYQLSKGNERTVANASNMTTTKEGRVISAELYLHQLGLSFADSIVLSKKTSKQSLPYIVASIPCSI